MKRVNSLFREPLVHFLLIGTGLFLLFSFTNGPTGDQSNRIVVQPGQISQMAARFSKTWMRPPTEEELAGLIENLVREEVYYREAVAMGLDQADRTIRQRMRMKLEFLLEDLSDVAVPDQDALTAYLQEHPEKFRREARVSFRQVYLDPRKHPDIAADARRVLKDIKTGAVPETAGDATLLGYEYRRASQSEITQSFGPLFAQEMMALTPSDWSGPFHSQYGVHLVMVLEREEARLPELAAIRDQVEREYLAQRRQEMKEMAYQRLRAKYQVVIASPSSAEGGSGEAQAAVRPERGAQ